MADMDVWYVRCAKCNKKVEVFVHKMATRDEVKQAFLNIGAQAVPSLCQKCKAEKDGKDG